MGCRHGTLAPAGTLEDVGLPGCAGPVGTVKLVPGVALGQGWAGEPAGTLV